MMLSPDFLNKLSEAQKAVALTKRGMTFIFKFLFKKGQHLFIVGATLSGKTQKAYWLANWIRHTRETIIWIDSAKNREMVPLITLGTPVRVICPKGCDVIFTEWNDDERKYTKMKNHPEVVQVPDAGSAWWAVKKGTINIFCFRNAFDSQKEARNWMRELFETLSVWVRKNRMPHILPFALFGDESHWFIAGEKITSDTERNVLSEIITELSLEDRAYGIRLVLMAQSYKSLPPASRENMIHNLLCRGAKVSPEENNTLSKYNNRTSTYHPNEGLFVYMGGYTYPEDWPWPFPFFPMPKIKVEYIGAFDSKPKEMIAQEEIEQEMQPDISKYQAIAQNLEGYEIPRLISRFEVPDDST